MVIILFFGATATVDYTDYQKTDYYKSFQDSLNRFSWKAPDKSGKIYTGWAKANITPDFIVPMAAYGNRGNYTAVHDSLYARTIVFQKGEFRLAYVSLDLLMVPHGVVKQVENLLAEAGHPVDHVYYSATHTHSGIGGFIEGFGGTYFAGEYDAAVVNFISQQITKSIVAAGKNTAKSKIRFGKVAAPDVVRNRLIPNGPTDPYVRTLKIEQKNGKTAVIVTFSAHATCLSRKLHEISRDYPGILVDSLEQYTEIDFAVFSAGAVASHAPVDLRPYDYENTNKIALSVLEKTKEAIQTAKKVNNDLRYGEINIPMGEPQFRIYPGRRLRKWVFEAVMPEWPTKVTFTKIGGVAFVGTPCDFSGEIATKIDRKNNKIDVNITSFNGGYVGYIIPDEYYTLDKYEPRDMNWFGPHTGAYFSEIIQRVLDLL